MSTAHLHDAMNARFDAAVEAESAGQISQAKQMYTALIFEFPDMVYSYVNLGTLYYAEKRFDEALALYSRAIQIEPNYALALFNCGNALDELGRQDEAVATYEKAIGIDPKYADAHYNLAVLLKRRSENRKAIKHLEAYLALDKNSEWSAQARKTLKTILGEEPLQIVASNTNPVRCNEPRPALFIVR